MAKQYLLDTNICVFILRGKYRLNEKIRAVGLCNCKISEITVAELIYGALCSEHPDIHMQEVENFCNKFEIIPITDSILTFAKIKSFLRKEGNLIDDFDLLIAATAVEFDFILVTDNLRHFERTGVIIDNWVER